MYKCKECELAVVILEDGEVLRPCGHEGTIIMDIETVIPSKGGVAA